MWDAIVQKYEGNEQIKQTKLEGLEIKFETFSVENGESVEDTYNKLLQIQNEFIKLGQPLSNKKIVRKFLRVMLRKPGWKSMVSALEVLLGVQVFTLEELFAHLRSCEENSDKPRTLNQDQTHFPLCSKSETYNTKHTTLNPLALQIATIHRTVTLNQLRMPGD